MNANGSRKHLKEPCNLVATSIVAPSSFAGAASDTRPNTERNVSGEESGCDESLFIEY